MPRPIRNPEGVLAALKAAIHSPRSNDMRVAQIIDNALYQKNQRDYDLFYQEDNELIEALHDWARGGDA